MKRKNIQWIAQTLLLLLMPAFIMRPVVVTVESGVTVSGQISAQKCVHATQHDLAAGHATFRSIARDNTQQAPVLAPCFTKSFLSSSESQFAQFVASSVCFSPQGFHVLRI